MKDEELMRRISDALDAPGGIDADEALRAALAEDPEAARYAEDLSAIDEALGQLGQDRPEPDWEAMLERIERGLDRDLEGLVDIGDPTAPPDFEDEAAPALPRVAAAASVTAAPVAAKAASGGEVVDLAARRKQRRQVFSLIGGLAAAAAVGLGITAGLSMNDTAPMAGFAMEEAAPAAPSVAEVPADMEMPAAAPEPEPAAEAPPPMAFAMGEAEADEPADDSAITAAGAFQTARAQAPRARGAAPSPDPAMDVLAEGFGGGRAGSGGGGGGVGYAVPAERATGSSTATPAQQPTRVEVVNALNEVADDVAACMRQTREVAQVRVRVNGSTGAVQSVTVQPPFRGAEAACIVRAVRGASMPTSASPSYEVVHAYHPAPIAGGSLAPTAPAARRARRPASPARSAPPSLRDQADVLSPWAE